MPDTLFLLTPGFPDEALPGRNFYCAHCALIEGVLASFPDLGNDIEVRRVAFPRPRKDVVALVGDEHQSLPLLILSDGPADGLATRVYGARAIHFGQGRDPAGSTPSSRLPGTASLNVAHAAFF